MATKKMDRSAYSPGWGEVILGAALSVGLGAVLGALALALRPVALVKELPKEPVKGVVYLLEGSRDSGKARQATAKRKSFVAGQSLTVTEDEINSLGPGLPMAAPPPNAAKPKAGEKAPATKAAATKAPATKAPAAGAPAAAPAGDELLGLGSPNLRIRDGVVQVIVPLTLNVLGLEQLVLVSSTGAFVKKDGGFVFDAATLMIGCCPMQRIPMATGFLAKRLLTAKAVPEDIAGAWGKLADVAVEGSALKLTMP